MNIYLSMHIYTYTYVYVIRLMLDIIFPSIDTTQINLILMKLNGHILFFSAFKKKLLLSIMSILFCIQKKLLWSIMWINIVA